MFRGILAAALLSAIMAGSAPARAAEPESALPQAWAGITREGLEKLRKTRKVKDYFLAPDSQFIHGDDLSEIFYEPVNSEADAASALRHVQSLLGIEAPAKEFTGRRTSVGGKNLYILAQSHKGVPVYGKKIRLYTSSSGIVTALSSIYIKIKDNIEITPTLSPVVAADIVRDAGGKQILSTELVVYAIKHHDPVLVWHVTAITEFESYEYFVDQSGAIIDVFSSRAFFL